MSPTKAPVDHHPTPDNHQSTRRRKKKKKKKKGTESWESEREAEKEREGERERKEHTHTEPTADRDSPIQQRERERTDRETMHQQIEGAAHYICRLTNHATPHSVCSRQAVNITPSVARGCQNSATAESSESRNRAAINRSTLRRDYGPHHTEGRPASAGDN